MKVRTAVVLVGSAKPRGASTSEALARYCAERLIERGVSTEVLFVSRSQVREDRQLAAALTGADLFVLVTPLYVDSLPFLVTRALESLAPALRGSRRPRACAAIVNCGFPEAAQCATALAIVHAFARRAKFVWVGGLALGEGGAIDGRPLAAMGRFTRRVREALDLAAESLAAGHEVPAAAIERMAERMIPSRLYTMAANYNWRRTAGRHGVKGDLDARPYDGIRN